MKDSTERLVLLYSRDQIARRVSELAAVISADYADADLVLIGILRGAFKKIVEGICPGQLEANN